VSLTEVLVAVLIAVGLAGILVPVLPGSVLVLAGVLIWALDVGGSVAWVVFAVVTVLLAVGGVVKYSVPGKRLKSVGFFVVPLVGVFLGFVLGIYLAEHRRLGSARAWPSTKHALRAVGLSILIELAAAVLAAGTWVVGVVLT
jgi:uncharacterized protein YqgC (DUF456 family)